MRTLIGLLVLMVLVSGGASASGTDLVALQKRFAPVIIQGCHGRADYFTRFDFDGNWNGDDNWENFEKVSALPAVVYTSAIESKSHVFLTYSLFHPRDWLPVNLPLVNHENDLEGVLVVVEKGAEPRVQVVETFAHYNIYRYAADPAQAGGKVHGQVRFEGEHPIVVVEAYKHGIHAYQEASLASAKGVIYRYKGVAGQPRGHDDKDVSYDFVTVESSFWAHRAEVGRDKAFAGTCTYAVGTFGSMLNGTKYANNRASPPWHWLDGSDKGLARGDWFFDPGLAMQVHYPAQKARFSREYMVHPFLFQGATARDEARARTFAALEIGAD